MHDFSVLPRLEVPMIMHCPMRPVLPGRKYWALTSAMYSASIADAELTHHCLQQKTCAFLPNALYNRAALYGIGIPADIGIMYLTYCMKGKHSPIWYVPSAFVTAANIYVGAHSYRRLK
jgi:hypothetical protein